ncbi:hypothetical protein AVMA1855_18710 [Acidovorax sp. SUPP1855]|uniref:hypothetical protein n=1 Tax=Acidovorax sp. SUPP1855 TaxID=431774 RepID=UPI0023DE5A45|nr:hypothetical protein [Acidovorax sp. SUPP1855]GKS86216.1 hypothetical protein AVMA1855_18710 [Acidovorax sp. SUPP1855]
MAEEEDIGAADAASPGPCGAAEEAFGLPLVALLMVQYVSLYETVLYGLKRFRKVLATPENKARQVHHNGDKPCQLSR